MIRFAARFAGGTNIGTSSTQIQLTIDDSSFFKTFGAAIIFKSFK